VNPRAYNILENKLLMVQFFFDESA